MTFLISFLFGLLCVWLLKRTQCINTWFIAPPVELAHRVYQRKTRRGWIGFSVLGLTRHIRFHLPLRRLNPDLVAMNAAAAEVELADEDKDAMLRELLDLDHNATDADVQSSFSQLDQEDAGEKAENAKRITMREEACVALGLAANATNDEFHAAILAVPTKLKEANDLAANEKKGRSTLLLDIAINDGRILQSQRSVYETAFNSDFTATAAKLASEGQKLNTTALQLAHRKELAANSRELEANVEVAVNELMAKGEPYLKAWNTVKADPKFKAFFDKPQEQISAE